MSKQRRSKQNLGTQKRFYQSLSGDQKMIGGVVIVVLIMIGVLALNSYRNRQVEIGAVEIVPIISSSHIDNPAQAETDHEHEDDEEHVHEIATAEDIARFDEQGLPPAGGPHYAEWLNCGIYGEPVPTGNALHSLEHGVIWITYRPDLSPADVAILRDVVGGSRRQILSPYPNLVSPVVATAWGFRLRLNDPRDERLRQFIHNYEDASSAPEPRASCSSGVGNPSAKSRPLLQYVDHCREKISVLAVFLCQRPLA